MKKYIKKTTTLLLLVSLIATALAACGDNSSNQDETSAGGGSESSAPEDKYLISTLPKDLNFNGATVTGYVRVDPPAPEFYIDEMNGDIVDDAIFKRNAEVSEKLGVKLEFYEVPDGWDNMASYCDTLQQSVFANEQAFDYVAGYAMSVANAAGRGLLRDMTTTKYINFDQPWWSDSLLSQSSVNGKLYFATGDISTNLLYNMFAMFFNKKMVENFKVEDPYKLVEEGKWTLDKLFEIAQGTYSDLNNNSTCDDADQYGLVVPYTAIDALYWGSGLMSTTIVDNVPKPSPDFEGEKIQSLLEKLCTQLYSNDDKWMNPAGETFQEGNIMFTINTVSIAKSKLRDAKFEYGLVPVPKYDESQENYCTITAMPYSLYGIPLDAKDADMSSAVLEALGAIGYRDVSPALFEVAMKVKYSSDDSASEMYDLIRESLVFDFGRIFANSLNNIPYGLFRNAVRDNTPNWTSIYGAQKEVYKTKLEALIEAME